MKKKIDYRCSRCGREVGRENLAVKKAQFLTVGEKPKFIRSRTVAWLCTIPDDVRPSCLDLDDDYNLEAVRSAPGGLATTTREAEAVTACS